MIGKEPEFCPSCGNLKRKLIKKFSVCGLACKFSPRCAYCLYISKFNNSSNRIFKIDHQFSNFCDSCKCKINTEKLESELHKIVGDDFCRKLCEKFNKN